MWVGWVGIGRVWVVVRVVVRRRRRRRVVGVDSGSIGVMSGSVGVVDGSIRVVDGSQRVSGRRGQRVVVIEVLEGNSIAFFQPENWPQNRPKNWTEVLFENNACITFKYCMFWAAFEAFLPT